MANIKATSTDSNVGDSYGDIKSNFYIISPDKLPILFAFIYKIKDDQVKQGELELRIEEAIPPSPETIAKLKFRKRVLQYMLHQIRNSSRCV